MDDKELLDRVLRCIEDTLALEPAAAAALTPETNLVEELGAESLDFLDLLFRLEDEFAIVLPQREFQDASRLGLAEQDVAAPDGTLTPRAIERLRELMPEADEKKLKQGLKKNEIVRCLTVASFAALVRRKLAEKVQVKA